MGDKAETAVLAGGCAWIMQQLLRHPEGVVSTRTGFMGGTNDNPTEENNGGHAEVVEVVFDPERLPSESCWRCSSRFTGQTLTRGP
jgi:peptide-methionine (S)-S-oxide reductase